jgi:hypothetical protein
MTTTTRRWLLLPVIAVALVLGAAAPANASFSRSASLAPISVATLKVAAATNVSTAGTKCVTTYDYSTGTYTTTLQAKISWTPSTTTRGVTGYLINAVFSDGTEYPVTSVGPTATSVSGSYDAYYATQNIRVTVTTMTSYGWTAETAPTTKAVSC